MSGTAALLSAAAKKAAADFAMKEVMPALKLALGRAYNQKAALSRAAAYAERLVNRVGFSKTFLHSDRPRHLQRFYVGLTFRSAHTTVADDFASIRSVGRCVAIIGHAGTGKSTTLKHLCYQAIERGGTIPIFLELRRLTSALYMDGKSAPTGIRDAICREIFGESIEKWEKQVEHILASGKLTIFLDGFDEVPKAMRLVLINDFYSLQERHPSIQWILSSRPDAAISALTPVHTLDPEPLTLKQIEQIVDRFDVNADQQAAFLSLVKSRLYEEHSSFARNPMLLAVLFFTFRTHQRIAERQSLFFGEVFEALCQRHDSKKDGFERELATKLDRDVFTKCVELFAFHTAVNSKLYFTKQELRTIVQTVLKARSVEVSTDDFISDLCQSISLLVEEGIEYTFIHRSLQEFLTARFMSKMGEDKQSKALAAVAPEPQQSLVVLLFHEVEPDVVQRCLSLPLIDEIIENVHFLSLRNYILNIYINLKGRLTPMIPLPKPWDSHVYPDDVINILRALYPNFRVAHQGMTNVWWTDEHGALLPIQPFTERAIEFFERTGNFGAAWQFVGFDYSTIEELKALRVAIVAGQQARMKTASSVASLVDDLLS